MLSAVVFCCILLLTLLTNLSTEGNSVDPDQAAPNGAVWSGSTLFEKEVSKTFRQTTKADDVCCDWSRVNSHELT